MATWSQDEFCQRLARVIARLYTKSGAERWGLGRTEFAATIYRSFAARFKESDDPEISEVESFLDSLYADDLALVCACSCGIERAWKHFVERYGPVIDSFAVRLAKRSGYGSEIGSSLSAELYGLEGYGAHRRGGFDYYHGRSPLEAWLKVVITRRYVDEWRAASRLEPLHDNHRLSETPSEWLGVDPDRTRYTRILDRAISEAIAELTARDRLRISYYYLHGMKLAQIAKTIGEHESTVSRRLDSTRAFLRRRVGVLLRRVHGLDDDQVKQCLSYAGENKSFDLAKALE
jgi:RNA polymerase sigma factor (sigma-70 family)